MSRTAHAPTPDFGTSPAWAEAWRPRVAPTDHSLEDFIFRLLDRSERKSLSLQEIERALAEDGQHVDTFVVREAVWRLIDKRKADYTPLHYLKAVGS